MAKSALATIPEATRVPQPDRKFSLDSVLMSATAEKILQKHPRPPGVLPVLILIAESEFHDKAATAKLLCAKAPARPAANVVLPGWAREIDTGPAKTEPNETFIFGNITVNVSTMEVCRGGAIVFLRCKEFQLLLYLLKNPRRVISRNELLKEVWGHNSYPTTRTVDNHVLRLRQKLEKEPNQPRHFVTIHGVGYRFLP